jgi:flavin-dependent dehydrogenase
VIGADGFYSTVAGAVRPAIETEYPVQRCMYYTYFSNLPSLDEPTAEHHFLGDSLTYIFPTDADLTLVALSHPIGEFSTFKKDPKTKLISHLKSLPLLVSRLGKAEIAAEVKGAGNIPGYQRIPYGPGWALVGDSQQIMDPWSGMGIDHTTTHVTFLAEALDEWLREQSSWESSMGEYHRRSRAWSEKSYRRTCTFAADLRPMTRAALQKRGLS